MTDNMLDETIKAGLDLLDKGNIKEAIKLFEGYWNNNRTSS